MLPDVIFVALISYILCKFGNKSYSAEASTKTVFSRDSPVSYRFPSHRAYSLASASVSKFCSRFDNGDHQRPRQGLVPFVVVCSCFLMSQRRHGLAKPTPWHSCQSLFPFEVDQSSTLIFPTLEGSHRIVVLRGVLSDRTTAIDGITRSCGLESNTPCCMHCCIVALSLMAQVDGILQDLAPPLRLSVVRFRTCVPSRTDTTAEPTSPYSWNCTP